ncbi:MAG: hypothetical protein ABIQ95_07325 [Bdellovibrionia bacterium]
MVEKSFSWIFIVLSSISVLSTSAYAIEVQEMPPIDADTSVTTLAPTPCVQSRGLWLWSTSDIINSQSEQNLLISMSKAANITDVFQYLVKKDYTTNEAGLRRFNAKLKSAGIRSWGLEGWRGYFSDSDGPALFYAAADALIAFNSRVAADEKFFGFQTDLEPQDGQGPGSPSSFHNGIPDSKLNKTGGGVVYPSQAQDREMLMRDWVKIQETLGKKIHAAGLKMGGAMPSWTSDYFGEEVKVTYGGIRQNVMKFMMGFLDEYLIMSYKTIPTSVASRVLAQVTYADTLPLTKRPRVYASVETHAGIGSGTSYADTPGKNTKTAVLADMKIIYSTLKAHPSFCGTNIHDWVGWMKLNP